MTAPCTTRTGDEELPDADDVPAEESRPRGLRARWARVRAAGEAGMSTAEYAVGILSGKGCLQAQPLV